MRRAQAPVAALAVAAAMALAVGLAAAKAGKKKTDTIPVDEITPGMKGHGVTVFSGLDPERFDVEVISVIHDFLPKQDLILARLAHPVLDHAGVIAGMSGSPVYLDGRLAGAVAYAWRFAKDPIAGITPAASMSAYLDMPLMPVPAAGPQPLPVSGPAQPGTGFFDRFDPEGSQMVPLATPVSGGGPLWSSFQRSIEPVLKSHFMVSAPAAPDAAGGGKAGDKTPAPRFRPGDAIAVQLVGGDLDMAGTGTVTMVEGTRALGFGHPMFNFGEVKLPASRAIIHHCLASQAFSFKMSESAEPMGSVVQDRQAGIMADTGVVPPTVELKIKLRDKTRGQKQSWNLVVAHHKQITPNLVRSAITSAVDRFALEVTDTVADGRYRVEVAGEKPLVFDDKVFLSLGTFSLAYSQRLTDALFAIMQSSFGDPVLERVTVDLDLEYGHDVATIAGAWADRDEVEEGDSVGVWVILKPHQGSEMTLGFELDVPYGTAGKDLSIDLKPGGMVPPEVVPPESLADVLDNLAKGYPDDKVVAVVEVPSPGVVVKGKHVHGIPLSALAVLQPKVAQLGEETVAELDRYFMTTPYLLEGAVSLKIKVKPK